MNEIQKHIARTLEQMQPGDRVSFGPYTFAEALEGHEPSPLSACFARIYDECRMDHVGEPEPDSVSARRIARAEFEADLARDRAALAAELTDA